MDDATRTDHPDEGTIHAWLDGALDAAAAAAIESHVAACAACAERVAEARGLIAGASRVLASLDNTPPVAPTWGAAPPRSAPARSIFRMTPARVAAAATIVVALGITLTRARSGPDSVTLAERHNIIQQPTAVAPMARKTDPVLDSAVSRNIAAALPPRTIKAAPQPAAPLTTPPAAVGSLARVDTSAPRAVAEARESRAIADVAAVPSDRAALGGRVAAPVAAPSGAPTQERRTAAKKAMSAERLEGVVVTSVPNEPATTASCYRIETANNTAARWGAFALPVVVSLDSMSVGAVFDSTGVRRESALAWSQHDDSLALALHTTSYEGSIALGAGTEARPGVMRSLEREPSGYAGGSANAQPSKAMEPTANVRLRGAPSRRETSALASAPATAVVARRTACPSR